ncbi:MAG: UDP-N-acetylmuramoyl-L-alanyl-D-glutamate--2,6-diaminopimelate ligase [Candidatus Kapaibacteriales bacterium]
MIKISEIIPFLNPKQVIGSLNGTINSICYNSLYITSNALFVAISGNRLDGHTFIDSAIDRGAKAIVCERLPNRINENCCYLVVEDSRRALAFLSHFYYNFPTNKIKVIGVTGTNGKTTVTYLLRAIFEKAGFKSAIIGTTGAIASNYKRMLNNTTPESLDLVQIFDEFLKRNVEIVAMEVSSHSLVQERVLGINFKAAIFTNLSQDHLDYHRSLEEYAIAKKKLFDSLGENSVAIFNSDDEFSNFMLSQCKAKNKISVGRINNSNIQITDEEIYITGSRFTLKFNPPYFAPKLIGLKTKLIGKFNIDNVALSVALAIEEGIRIETIQSAIEEFEGVPGRMQKVELKNGALGLVDYAHTPDALEKALLACREIIRRENNLDAKLICVFGCGGDRDKEKRPLMGKIASSLADYVVVTSDNPRTEDPDKIILQIYEGIPKPERKKVILITNRDEAINYAVKNSKIGDIILVAGKGHEDYQIIGGVKYHFSDVEYLKKFGQ